MYTKYKELILYVSLKFRNYHDLYFNVKNKYISYY